MFVTIDRNESNGLKLFGNGQALKEREDIQDEE